MVLQEVSFLDFWRANFLDEADCSCSGRFSVRATQEQEAEHRLYFDSYRMIVLIDSAWRELSNGGHIVVFGLIGSIGGNLDAAVDLTELSRK